ncbi:ATM interactor [Erythrolamprus reginae]|uniref:ATM interactor n=1 Tax=Erythrolamprus reginae TaxID=121349 RepID=UPI00396CA230
MSGEGERPPPEVPDRSNMAAAASPQPPQRGDMRRGLGRPRRPAPRDIGQRPSSPREMVTPSVTELSRAVRSNILCTVPGCGKLLPNPPALSMHLSKAHRLQQDGKIYPAMRKDLKTPQKYYCCPIQGCPRGPERPFSQFSLVRQHFMKMHAEKKHKCDKCTNSYGTIWDLKRHIVDCGKIFQCTCGCPYASRTALLSHIYRTQHEIPVEHRDPPSKKRKSEISLSNCPLEEKTTNRMSASLHSRCASTEDLEIPEIKLVASSFEDPSQSYFTQQAQAQPKNTPKFLLPKPKVGLVKLPVMQLTQLPILVPAPSSSVKPVVVTMDEKGSVMSTVHLMPLPVRIMIPALETEALPLKTPSALSRTKGADGTKPVSTGIQVNLGKAAPPTPVQDLEALCYKDRICSTNVQTDLSYFSQNFVPSAAWPPDSSVSSCSQTDLTFSSQALLPVSVETQTLLPSSKLTSSIAAQTDVLTQACFQPCGISRETQTGKSQKRINGNMHMDQTVTCSSLFNSVDSSFPDSNPMTHPGVPLMATNLDQNMLPQGNCKTLSPDTKCEPLISFNSPTNSILPQQIMTDNQTQTMELLNDLETIFSNNSTGHSLDNRSLLMDTHSNPGLPLSSVSTQNAGIDFDIEEFFTASNIQTQTEEAELGNLNVPTLEFLDIETQTDLFSDHTTQSYTSRGNSNFLGLEMFDTQTQTDLNFFLDTPYLPLGSILKPPAFLMSADSSNTETQTEMRCPDSEICDNMSDSKVQLSSAETQTIDSCLDTLGSLFLTSNETQTVMDDFLLADLAWNTMESQFSSVETQTCAELCSLLQGSSKASC